jgi:hypothetical protein
MQYCYGAQNFSQCFIAALDIRLFDHEFQCAMLPGVNVDNLAMK